MKKRWQYQLHAEMPDWVAKVSHERDCSPYVFVWTVGGITEVYPGEWISRVARGVRSQIVRATDAV